ncbi:MAG TPA: aminoglycoside phosphotransferase family protein [Frankiaceae bacterium]|nr:aminoglycoside phosphotransferase family protein [Frankiaceae bacterium]
MMHVVRETRETERLSHYVGVVATAWEGSFGREPVRLVEGRDTDAVVVGTTAVFRFPRNHAALDALPREVAALTALNEAGRVDDVLPNVLVDSLQNPLGRAFVAQRYLGGDPLPRASVDAVGPMAYRFAVELARLLDALAATPATGLPLTSAPLYDDWDTLAAAAGPAAATAFADVKALDKPDPVLVHGDLNDRALRWDADDTRLTGVLGWSQVHLGDPAYDLASLADGYGWDLAETVAAATARADRDVMRRARVYAATFPFQRSLGGTPAPRRA